MKFHLLCKYLLLYWDNVLHNFNTEIKYFIIYFKDKI